MAELEEGTNEAPAGVLTIPPYDENAAAGAQARWNAVAKPLGALGTLEDIVVQIAGLTGDPHVDISRRCVVVLCADNGVVRQGVTQVDSSVTRVVARNVAEGISSVCRMCAPVGIDCLAVDMGMNEPIQHDGIINRRIGAGTGDITCGPAMTRSQARDAIKAGIDLVGELSAQGYRLIATGEMGIGNTTTSAAVACAFTGRAPRDLVGRGAGLSDAGLVRKVAAVEQALRVNDPDPNDPVDVLAKLGGFDIAGMCGLCLGGAVHRVPIVLDGVASIVAGYAALRLRPDCASALVASHRPAEPAAWSLLDELTLKPIIDAGMRLGEGTGAACLIPLIDMACSLYEGTTFEDCGLTPYEVNPR